MFRLIFCLGLFALIGWSVYTLHSGWPLVGLLLAGVVIAKVKERGE